VGEHRSLSDRPNLMLPGSTKVVRPRDAGHLDTKRLDDKQEALIHRSRFAKNP
jgi:hypothetical protein